MRRQTRSLSCTHGGRSASPPNVSELGDNSATAWKARWQAGRGEDDLGRNPVGLARRPGQSLPRIDVLSRETVGSVHCLYFPDTRVRPVRLAYSVITAARSCSAGSAAARLIAHPPKSATVIRADDPGNLRGDFDRKRSRVQIPQLHIESPYRTGHRLRESTESSLNAESCDLARFPLPDGRSSERPSVASGLERRPATLSKWKPARHQRVEPPLIRAPVPHRGPARQSPTPPHLPSTVVRRLRSRLPELPQSHRSRDEIGGQ